MRVLLTSLPEYGHFHTLVPLGAALIEGGHQVAFATGADLVSRVEDAGFVAFPAGISHDLQVRAAREDYPVEAALTYGQERFRTFVPLMLAGVAAPSRAADLVKVVDQWEPDILVHNEAEFGGPVAAAAAGIPYAAQSVGMLRPLSMARLAAETLAPTYEAWGVDVGPFAGLFQYLYLDVCPPSLQSPEISEVPVAHSVDAEGKPVSLRTGLGRAYDAAAGDVLPSWIGNLAGAPTVYVTLGTLNHNLAKFELVLEALREEPVNIVLTVGMANDPAALGPQPANVHVERYIPQSLLLPHCDVVLNHAGSVLPVLGHGLPLLMAPVKGNEFQNADACVGCGGGRQLLGNQFSPETVRHEIRTLLQVPSFSESARRVAGEIAALPGPEEGVRLLERMARERRPLVRETILEAPAV